MAVSVVLLPEAYHPSAAVTVPLPLVSVDSAYCVCHCHVSVALLVSVKVTLVALTWVKALLVTWAAVHTYCMPTPPDTGELVTEQTTWEP